MKNQKKNNAFTSVLAVAGKPRSAPLNAVIAEVVLTCTPMFAAVTSTEKVQDAPAASVAPDRLMVLVPCVAVIVPPPHEPARPLGVEMISPDGSTSVNAMAVRGLKVGKATAEKLTSKQRIEIAKKRVPNVGATLTRSVLKTDGSEIFGSGHALAQNVVTFSKNVFCHYFSTD